MSSLIYGAMNRRRANSPSNAPLWVTPKPTVYLARSGVSGDINVAALENAVLNIEDAETSAPLSRWVDAAAALIPIEVLTIHAFVMSAGTITTGTGSETATAFSHPEGVAWAYLAMLLLCAVLYLAGARQFNWKGDFLRMLIPVGAFIGWTMVQPGTAFDALGIPMDPDFARPVFAVFLIVVLGVAAQGMAGRSDREGSPLS